MALLHISITIVNIRCFTLVGYHVMKGVVEKEVNQSVIQHISIFVFVKPTFVRWNVVSGQIEDPKKGIGN